MVSLSPIRGFDAPVRLSVEGGTSDIVTALSPRAVVPPASVAVAVGAGPSIHPGTFPLTIAAAGGERMHTTALSIVIAAPTATPTAMPTVAPTPPLPPLPVATPLPPVDLQPLWLGVGLAGGSVGIALVLAVLSLLHRRRARPRWRAWGWAILLLAMLAVGLVIGWQYIESRRLAWTDYQAHIRPGVTVAGIDAGGMAQDELYRAVKARAVAPYRREIVVHYGARSTILNTESLDLQTNLDKIVAQAAAVGQEQASQGFRAFLTQNPEPFDVHLPLTYTLDDNLLVPWVDDLADEIETPPVEPAWNPKELVYTRGQAGSALDVDEALRELRAALPNLAVHEVELPVTQVEPVPWTDDEITAQVSRAVAQWHAPPLPAAIEQITIPFDAERWIGPDASADDWQPTRPMTGYVFLPGQMGWTLDVPAVEAMFRAAQDAQVPLSSTQAFTDVSPPALALEDIKPALVEIADHFDGWTGLYVQDLETGDEIRHNTYVTTSGMSMIKVAIMATAYRSITRPFSAELESAISEMIAHSINAKSNYVILQIGEGDFQQGMVRVNETLQAMGMGQTYIASAYRVVDGPTYERIPVPERPAVAIPPEEQIDLWPDAAMQTSLSDQVILFEALYRGTQGTGRLLEAFPSLTPEDCQKMIDLLKTNPTRTLLGAGFADDVPLAHKHGFGGGQATDERMDVGIVWPAGGHPYLVGMYQWDKSPWIHWLRVWPQQIELSTTLYYYFTMPPTRPAPDKP
jgi:beta-lactamase class A